MKKLTVLLVDDEIMIREGFKRLFDWEAHGCQVVGEAADGMEALGKIDSLRPDIVIMDINIPILNGLKVIQTARIRYPRMAFVIVSGYDDFAYCQQALRMQITDYMLKPVDYEEFGTCIDNLKISLFRQQTAQEPEEQEEAEQAVEDTALFQSRQRIADLLSGLEETDAKLLTLRFGLEGGKPVSPEETGRLLGLTAQEVVAREAAALAKLRNG